MMAMSLRAFFAIIALAATCGLTQARAEAPLVVASIAPVHSLVAGVMTGVAEPELLVEGGGSPHTYSLRPSEAQVLQDAEVVFWIGEGLETFLAGPLDALPKQARIVALHEADGVTLLPYRRLAEHQDDAHKEHHGEHEAHEHDHVEHEAHANDHGEHEAHENHHEEHDAHEGHHGEHHDHAHGETDMHIWLDPVNARAMVTHIVETLSDADPENASRYAENGAAVTAQLVKLEKDLRGQLAPIRGRPYVVFHDAYGYFETRFGLRAAGSISVSPERQPSAAKLAAIRETISAAEVICVFSEPQFEPRVVRAIIDGTGARTGVLDPLGASVEPGPELYFVLMRNLSDSLTDCLSRES